MTNISVDLCHKSLENHLPCYRALTPMTIAWKQIVSMLQKKKITISKYGESVIERVLLITRTSLWKQKSSDNIRTLF
jgi:hypothetical protein